MKRKQKTGPKWFHEQKRQNAQMNLTLRIPKTKRMAGGSFGAIYNAFLDQGTYVHNSFSEKMDVQGMLDQRPTKRAKRVANIPGANIPGANIPGAETITYDEAAGGVKSEDFCDEESTVLQAPPNFFYHPCRFVKCWIKQWYYSNASSFPLGSVTLHATVEKKGWTFSAGNLKKYATEVYTTPKQFNPSGSTEVCVKINYKTKGQLPADTVMESIIQVYLWCKIRNGVVNNYWRNRLFQNNLYAKIPEVHQLVRSLDDPTSTTALPSTDMIVMQPLQGTLLKLIQDGSIDRIIKGGIVNEAFKQLALTLSVLQKSFMFEHRDLHLSNVMYTVVNEHLKEPITADNLQFYMIDFGLSIIHTENDTWLFDTVEGKDTSKALHYVNKTLRPGGDLVQVALDLRQKLKEMKPWGEWQSEWWAKNLDKVDIEKGQMIKIKGTYTHAARGTGKPPHWIGYSDRYHYTSFNLFSPDNVLKNFPTVVQAGLYSMNQISYDRKGN